MVRTNNVKELELVVGRGASINEVDVHSDDKFTPLHWAAYAGSLEVCSDRLINSIDETLFSPLVHALVVMAIGRYGRTNTERMDTRTYCFDSRT